MMSDETAPTVTTPPPSARPSDSTSSSSSSREAWEDEWSRFSSESSRSFYAPAGALTTVWTPTCTVVDTEVAGGYNYFTTTTLSSDPWWANHKTQPTCRPPGWQWPADWRPYERNFSTSDPKMTWIAPYYSPGICPSGYTPGCARDDWGDHVNISTVLISASSSREIESYLDISRKLTGYSSLLGPALTEGETATICIPSGWECDTRTRFAEVTGPFTFSSTYRQSAPWVQIRWADSDLPRLETHPLTPGMIMNATLASAAALTSARRAEASLKQQLGETSDAWASEKAARTRVTLGLAISFGIVALSLAGALLALLWRYRKLRRDAKAAQAREMENFASLATTTELEGSNRSLRSIHQHGRRRYRQMGKYEGADKPTTLFAKSESCSGVMIR
ncbi:hypothetical protein PG984_011362 [Apiospora sp. TS-2023a]